MALNTGRTGLLNSAPVCVCLCKGRESKYIRVRGTHGKAFTLSSPFRYCTALQINKHTYKEKNPKQTEKRSGSKLKSRTWLLEGKL